MGDFIRRLSMFEKGDRVYHKNFQLEGTFIGYGLVGETECHVNFDTEDGHADCKQVTTSQLELIKSDFVSRNDMLLDVMYKVFDLEISSPVSMPERAKRELSKILKKFEFGDDFIEGISVDTLEGFDAAISIVKGIISDKIHQNR